MQSLIQKESFGFDLSPLAQHQLPEFVTHLQAEPGGGRFAASDAGGQMALLNSRGEAHIWTAHKDFISGLAWLDSRHLSSLSEDGRLKLWDSQQQSLIQETQVRNPGALAVHPEAGWIATSSGKMLLVWNKQLEKVAEMEGFQGTIEDLAFFPAGKGVAVAAMGGIHVLPPDGVGEPVTLSFQAAFLKVAISPDGKMLAGGCLDQAIRFWQLPQARLLHLEGYGAKVRHLAFDPRGGFLASGSLGDVVVWDVREGSPEGKEAQMPPPLEGIIQCLAFHPKGRLFAVGTDAGVLGVYSIEGHSGSVSPVFLGKWDGPISVLTFSPSSSVFCMGFGDGRVEQLNYQF